MTNIILHIVLAAFAAGCCILSAFGTFALITLGCYWVAIYGVINYCLSMWLFGRMLTHVGDAVKRRRRATVYWADCHVEECASASSHFASHYYRNY